MKAKIFYGNDSPFIAGNLLKSLVISSIANIPMNETPSENA